MLFNFLTSWLKNEAVQVGGSDMVTNTCEHEKEKNINLKAKERHMSLNQYLEPEDK